MKRVVIFAIAVAACAAAPAAPYLTKTTFDPSEVAWSAGPGRNTVEGQAFLRQRGGGVVTCAGASVQLIPDSAYARERFMFIYGTATQPAASSGRRIDAPNTAFVNTFRHQSCDAQGGFRFSEIPDGNYYVVTTVQWEVAGVRQGGNVMAPVSLAGGETRQIIVAP